MRSVSDIYQISWKNEILILRKESQEISIKFLAEDLFDFLSQQNSTDKFDLLIAHAFLDLVDIPATLPKLFSLLHAKSLFYFTINFDGETIFEPNIPHDEQILANYHHTMDARIIEGKLSGDSRAGRHLFSHLKSAGSEILSAGSSDWVVFANQNAYTADETYFLQFIVNTVHNALKGGETDQNHLDAWASTRHAQVTSGALVYIAHQLDFLGRIQ